MTQIDDDDGGGGLRCAAAATAVLFTWVKTHGRLVTLRLFRGDQSWLSLTHIDDSSGGVIGGTSSI